MSDLHVAFFRLLNLGHPGCPHRAGLEAAFRHAGGTTVRSVQTNGTVVFGGGPAPSEVVAAVLVELGATAGYAQPVLVRSAERVAELLSGFPPYDGLKEVHRACVTLHDADRVAEVELPWTSPLEDLVLLATTPDHTASVIRRRGASVGDPNRLLERLLGVPATTRTTGTVQRVLAVAETLRA